MAPNRITLLLATIALGLGLAGCGDGGTVATTPPDKERDARVLNALLGRQEAAVGAYQQAMRLLGGPELRLARHFRAQEQEHVDATVRTMRGLGIEPDPAAEEIDLAGLSSEAETVELLYEVESATIDLELNAISRLSAEWMRPLIGTMAANQAERLVLLRRALGASPLEAVPDAFEDGTVPAPSGRRPTPKPRRQASKQDSGRPHGKE